MTCLPSKPSDLRNRYAVRAFYGESLPYFVGFERPNDNGERSLCRLTILVLCRADLAPLHSHLALRTNSNHIRHGFVLRIRQHTELGDIEAGKLHLFVDAHRADRVHH